jgi:endonuclease/exonuclease/phosphatase family metal-dependent hydrolase
LLIATWNLNHRVGCTPYRADAARAAAAIGADVLVLTEYFPKEADEQFSEDLRAAGYWMSVSDNRGVRANTVLLASRLRASKEALDLPDFDDQCRSNLHAIRLLDPGIVIVGVRVPWYVKEPTKVALAWEWLEQCAARYRSTPAIIAGDLNTAARRSSRGGDVLLRMLDSGWSRAIPTSGGSFVGKTGQTTEIDHILVSPECKIAQARYIAEQNGTLYAGEDGLSDHAVLAAEVSFP